MGPEHSHLLQSDEILQESYQYSHTKWSHDYSSTQWSHDHSYQCRATQSGVMIIPISVAA